MNTIINSHESRPTQSGVYATREVDVETGEPIPGSTWLYSFFDLTDRIWGCSHPDPQMAIAWPEFEYASQSKEWSNAGLLELNAPSNPTN